MNPPSFYYQCAILVSFMLVPWSAQAAEEKLPEVQVNTQTEQESPTGFVRGYTAKRSATATKTDTSILETPQSISVITADQIEDQRAQSIQEVLRYSAGVVADQYGLDSRADSYAVRGMDATQYLNGLRGINTFYSETTRPDPYAMERVEILRGPSSMLYGGGGVGGIVNLVSKRPQEIAKREMGVSLGNYQRKQIQADFTGPVADSDTLFYRLVLLGRDSDSQVKHAYDERTLIAPSLTWKPSDKTSLTLLGQYQLNDGRPTPQFLPWSGVLRSNPNGKVPGDNYIGDPSFDRYTTESTHLGWAFDHAFNDTISFRQNARYTSSRNDYRSLYPNSFSSNPYIDASQRVLNRYVDVSISDSTTVNIDNHLQAKFNTGSVEHTVLLGLDYARFRQARTSGSDSGTGNPIDVYDPVYNPVDTSGLSLTDQPVARLFQTGVYLQDQVKFDRHWILTAGIRRDDAKNQKDGSDAQRDHALTQRYGLSYVADNGWAPYVSYAESFLPVAGTSRGGELFKPQEGKQWEVGIKYQPVGSRSRFTAALFDIHDKNRTTPDPLSPTNSVQKGEIHSRGLELEAVTSLPNHLDIIASYSYTDAQYSKTNIASEKGNQVETIPKHLASAWAVKRFSIAEINGWRAGLGVRYLGSSSDSNDQIKAPDATLVDAMLGLDYGSWRYALNASNLFDKEYVSTCLARGDCWLGARRQVIASATYYW
ncbi:TonB-dependent siderophore receptor [Methylobacillus gramineus]|uniref:TonB-dependent siderophore receptor n=1 Tax=Methylobacillus gramineus TaxID=755169 RepID=UPI001CFF685D|nr:TonB-dependent siderophore receptor [Methylobacillus gramineus]MCB5185921.1 TonB-dependent siderophore receptor [Methylobacillus gramineus]